MFPEQVYDDNFAIILELFIQFKKLFIIKSLYYQYFFIRLLEIRNSLMDISKRRKIYQDQFYNYDNHNELISKESLLKFLDQQSSNGYYDRSVFNQLYERMKKNFNGYITINDYIDVILEAEGSLMEKITFSKQQLREQEKLLKEYENKLRNVQRTERYNKNNISEESKINVQIIEAEVLFPGASAVYLILGLGDEKIESSAKIRGECYWDESYEFPVVTGEEQLWVVLMDYDLQKRQEIGGQAAISIVNFKDQLTHDVWVDLKDRQNVILRSKVHLSIQWIHSKLLYLQELVAECSQKQQELKFDIEDYQKDMDTIQFFAKKQTKITPDQSTIEMKFLQNDNPEERYHNISDLEKDINYSMYATFAFLFLALITSLGKVTFLDSLIIFYSLIFYSNNVHVRGLFHVKIIIGLYIFSLGIDFFWLIEFSQNWANKTGGLIYYAPEANLHKFEVIMTWLLFFSKLGLGIFFIIIAKNFPKDQDVVEQDAQFQEIYPVKPQEIPFKQSQIRQNPLNDVQKAQSQLYFY